jgi:molybdopterin synthase sulfur carrier subunit
MPVERLRVAVDGAFADWGAAPAHGSEIAFIPPVSGG